MTEEEIGKYMIGTEFIKFFIGYGHFQGTVDSYAAGRFMVSYSDGDKETLTLHQIVQHLTAKTRQSLATNKDNKEKHTTVKDFLARRKLQAALNTGGG
eukprot:CAMPEP_0173117196 /NCGR_PEP_ID=MMETSP1102-20130122/50018_1 /TAXON_ID=49646 /ORGANISM="Geminigera sp., Strain Caron Lab Isolate" /LENGTH=97 /DNA_ID=CAMNT_0014021509 /DNA_START=45 /DNA_END=334 /DNA_ORIENTATION=-